MKECKRCGSHAINQDLHGRVPGKHKNLCDVCYWRTEAELNIGSRFAPKDNKLKKNSILVSVMIGEQTLYATAANYSGAGVYSIKKNHAGFRDTDQLYLEDQYGYRYRLLPSVGKYLAFFKKV